MIRRPLRSFSIALSLPLLLVAALLLAINTGPGQRLLAWGVAEATGGQVALSGLSGRLPLAPRLTRLELRDGQGIWLAADDAVLDLNPWRLLHGELAVESLTARTLVLTRLPTGEGGEGGPFRLPLKIRVERLAIADLDLAGLLPGAPRLAVEASAALRALDDLELRASATAPGRADRYRLEGAIAPGGYRLALEIAETPGGALSLLAQAAGVQLPAGLADWTLNGRAEGPAQALTFDTALSAGPLRASAKGTLDLDALASPGLKLAVDLPAMALGAEGQPGAAPALAWTRIGLKADLQGALTAPQGTARLEAEGLAGAGFALARLTATANGNAQRLGFEAAIAGLTAPIDLPPSAAQVPLKAAGELDPLDPARPIRLRVSHPLLDLEAQGELTARIGRATLTLPDLTPLGALAGQDLAGRARLELAGAALPAPRLDASAELALTRAPGPTVALLGPSARLKLAVRGEGAGWRIAETRLDGAAIRASAQGLASATALDLGWTLDLPNLAALAPGWSGRLETRGTLTGAPRSPALVADLMAQARLAAPGPGQAGPPMAGRVTGRLSARPSEPAGSLDLRGDWAGQPVAVALKAGRGADGALSLDIGDSRWASIAASGSLRLPAGAALPLGEMRLRADRLADLAPFLALAQSGAGSGAAQSPPTLAGRLTARLVSDPAAVRIESAGEGLALPGALGIGALALDARVTEPLGAARTEATLRLTRLAAGQVSGDIALAARGPVAALDLTADASLATLLGPTSLALAGRADGPARVLALSRLEARAQGETLRLLAPARLDLKDGVAVDRLRLGLAQGTLDLAGRLAPRLDLDATLARLPLDLVRLVPGAPALAGTLGAQVRLAGALDAPTGTLRLQASGLRLTQGQGRAIPPAGLDLSADLGTSGTELDARAQVAGRADMRLRGRIAGRLPAAPGALALRADGRLDLALLDPLLTAGGRQASGQATLATAISGTFAAPRLDGNLRLENAALRDRTLGLALAGIQGNLRLAGDTVRIERLTARAGRGTLDLEGRVGVLAPGIPTDLRLVARNARPIQSDLVEVKADADLRLAGHASGRLDLRGSARLIRVEIRLPERLPPSVATLQVRELGSRRNPPPAGRGSGAGGGAPDLGLDLRVTAPRAIFVRGRGVDAELGGAVEIRGTLADPVLAGGFNLARGQYKLAGQTLRFTRGRIGFEGAALADPSLDLEARVTTAGSTAILAVVGTARDPRIELRGEPELPQDEVLARLLFGVAGGRLSAVQAAQLGMAAASLAGIGQGGPGILERARGGLGLDRLGVATDERGEAVLEGGRYISERVYLGARQGGRAGETQGVLRIEVTPQIRLEADVGAAGGTRAGAALEREY